MGLTHDELLAKITNQSCCSGIHELALRAVVELHKPHKIPDWVPTKIEFDCEGCLRVYPCPTIQAIEKELQ